MIVHAELSYIQVNMGTTCYILELCLPDVCWLHSLDKLLTDVMLSDRSGKFLQLKILRFFSQHDDVHCTLKHSHINGNMFRT